MRPLLEWPASFPAWPVGFWPPKMELLGPSTDIRIEEFDSDHHRVIRAEIPGIDPEKDVSLTVDDDVLNIDITRERRAEKTESGQFRSEFSYGHLHRAVHLVGRTGADDVKATYRDGILEIRVRTNGHHGEKKRIPISRA
jgi:HSP20 family protein